VEPNPPKMPPPVVGWVVAALDPNPPNPVVAVEPKPVAGLAAALPKMLALKIRKKQPFEKGKQSGYYFEQNSHHFFLRTIIHICIQVTFPNIITYLGITFE